MGKTLKQKRLLKHLPASKTVAEAGRKAGYSDTSGSLYRKTIKALIDDFLAENAITDTTIKEQFKRICKIALDKGDLANANRALEALAKSMGLFKEGKQQQVAIFQGLMKDLPVKQRKDEAPNLGKT